jgi:hypothetical protein
MSLMSALEVEGLVRSYCWREGCLMLFTLQLSIFP